MRTPGIFGRRIAPASMRAPGNGTRSSGGGGKAIKSGERRIKEPVATRVLMNFDNRIGECEWPCPVGTRGGVGWMRGPCACPRPVYIMQQGIRNPNESCGDKGKHKAPTLPRIRPCPYRFV